MNPEENNDSTPDAVPSAAGPNPVNNNVSDSTSFSSNNSMPDPALKKDNNNNGDDEDEDPIEPAKPVPGSIGSALQYDENAPGHVSKVQKPPFEWTKKRIIAAASIGAAALIIAIVATVIIIVKNNQPSTSDEDDRMISDMETEFITCERENYSSILTSYTFTSEEYGHVEPESTIEKFRAVYKNEDPYDVAYTLSVTFPEENHAITGIDIAGEIYGDALKTKNIKEDPFTSTYSSNGRILMVSRYALMDDINSDNAELLGIGTTKGEVANSIEQIEQKFISKGYTCEVSKADQ